MKTGEQTNILVIMSDQHRADFMGCAGHQVCRTPNLDRLAERGVLFSRAYCPFPLCGPSRMAFMTGRHPCQINCWTNDNQLAAETPTFAHALLAGGYDTILAGRMHFVGLDQRHGFQQRILGDVPESVHIAAGWKLRRVLGDLIDTPGYSPRGIVKSGPGRTGYQAYDQVVCRTTADWLLDRGRSARRDTPFLLVAGFAMPHCPFVAPPEDFDYYASRISPRDLPDPREKLHPVLAGHRSRCGLDDPPPAEARWRATVAYYGMCSLLDRQVGQILQALQASGLAHNTVVVYTSDHGELLGDHGLWWKDAFYESSCCVPLIVSAPGRLPEGRVVAHLANLIDIAPTLLDVAGVEPLADCNGTSLLGRCHRTPERSVRPGPGNGDSRGERPDEPLPAPTFAEDIYYVPEPRLVIPARMAVQGPWKYNYYHQEGEELFNLQADPAERRNVAGLGEHSAVRDHLRAAVLTGWDPEIVQRRLKNHSQRQRLLAAWVNKSLPPEPDPIWFDHPPENCWQEVLPPDEAG